MKVKLWAEGTAEPANWSLEVTDGSIKGAGWFGPVSFTNYRARIKKITWALAGATASFLARHGPNADLQPAANLVGGPVDHVSDTERQTRTWVDLGESW